MNELMQMIFWRAHFRVCSEVKRVGFTDARQVWERFEEPPHAGQDDCRTKHREWSYVGVDFTIDPDTYNYQTNLDPEVTLEIGSYQCRSGGYAYLHGEPLRINLWEYLKGKPETNPLLPVALVAAAYHHVLQALSKIMPQPYCPEALALEEYLNTTDLHKKS